MVRSTHRTLLRGASLGALAATFALPASAQQPQWGPSRLPEHSSARPINQAPARGESSPFLADRPQASHPQALHSAEHSAARGGGDEQLGSGVTLRWRNVAPTAASNAALAQTSRLRQQVTQQVSSEQSPAVSSELSSRVNPLRSQVMQAAYQQGSGDVQLPFGGDNNSAPPQLPQESSSLPNLPGMLPDPLNSPELPPLPTGGNGSQPSQPGSILEIDPPANPFPKPSEEPSPADRGPERLPPPQDVAGENGAELERRPEITSSGYCDEMRARIHANPITAVSLDTSPDYGAGFRVNRDAEQQRLDFAASAPVRDWTDYRGNVVATGRMIDLRDGRVVIDIDGREQLIPFRDLSDVDTAYVGQAWNIPERCGTGYDPFDGRDFVPSTVQWAASGLCHKPLYFEQVQLERYGHEIGPVLQPLVSSAHFFGNIPLLPYKMGIHPPNECQYALGYYRPGNCAPYMIQPIPWSLRGAAVQAAAVTGAAALIP